MTNFCYNTCDVLFFLLPLPTPRKTLFISLWKILRLLADFVLVVVCTKNVPLPLIIPVEKKTLRDPRHLCQLVGRVKKELQKASSSEVNASEVLDK